MAAAFDTVAAFGLSFGIKKFQLAQHSVKLVGEIVGRDGCDACDHHLDLIKRWGPLEEIGALRLFLGTFNWIRGHFPKEALGLLDPDQCG